MCPPHPFAKIILKLPCILRRSFRPSSHAHRCKWASRMRRPTKKEPADASLLGGQFGGRVAVEEVLLMHIKSYKCIVWVYKYIYIYSYLYIYIISCDIISYHIVSYHIILMHMVVVVHTYLEASFSTRRATKFKEPSKKSAIQPDHTRSEQLVRVG